MTKIILLRISILAVFISLFSIKGNAQLTLTNAAFSATVDFSATMQATVGNGYFKGLGFSPAPASGQLNSNAWAITNLGSSDLLYGGTQTTASTSYTRGAIAAAVNSGGVYAYTGAPGTVTNPALMIQPSGTDFAPGTLTLRIKNNGTTIITQLVVSYNLFVRNDQPRSSSFNFSYSTDDATYTAVPLLDYTTPVTADGLGWVLVNSAPSRSTTITGLNIPPGTYGYIRWSSADVAGSNNRDEIGLDDISVSATYSTPCTPPTTQPLTPTFSNVLSNQMDLNFVRGNGTGGILIVASTSPTLSSNPVSGVTYTGNANFGNGTALGGGYVVYRGPAAGALAAATITVSGLSPGTTYYFYLFEFDVTVPCYNTSLPGTGNQATAAGSATNPTDYFQSNGTGGGNWNNASTWKSSSTSAAGPWIIATIKPTLSARGIAVTGTDVVTITADETAKMLSIAAGSKLTYSNTAGGGYNLDIAADPAGVDFQISGIYELFGIQPNIASGATVEVYNGGTVKASGNAAPGASDDFARSAQVLFKTGSVFDWNNTLFFETSSKTYFGTATAADIATFRVSQNPGIVGAGTFTTIQGILEVNGNLTFANAGDKTFRNGIIGTGTLTQSSACQFIIDGGTAILGGTGPINLNASGRLRIATGSITSMTSNKTINSGPITVDGTLYADTYIILGSSSFALSAAGTLRMGSPDGITSGATLLGNIQSTAGRTFDPAGNYIYNSAVSNQTTGNGLPFTITGFLTISNTAAAGSNTVSLTISNTTVTTFNLAAGLFAAGGAQNLKIASGGTVTGTGGNQTTIPATAGIIYFISNGTITPPAAGLSLTNVEIHGAVSFSTISPAYYTTIKDTLNIGNNGSVVASTAPKYSSIPASTLLYTCNCNYNAAEEWYPNNFGNVPGVPHHVTLAAGTSLNFTNAVTREMRGDLLIGTGSVFTLSTTNFSDLNIMGNWTRNAGGSFVSNGKTVRFNGTSGTQWVTATGGGVDTFAYIIINKTAGQNLMQAAAPNPTDILLNGNAGGYALQLANGNLDINGQTFTFTSYFNGNQNDIGIDGTAGNLNRNITSTSGTGIFALHNPNNVTRFITITRLNPPLSLLSFGSTVTVTTDGVGPGGGGINFGNTISTINGILQINQYGYVTGFAPTYATGSFLKYNSGGLFDRNVEWGSLSGPGYPYNVTVQNNTTLTLNTAVNGNADRAMAANLLIMPGSSLSLGAAYANKLTVGGNVQIDGGLTLSNLFGGDIYIAGNWNRSATGTFTANNRAVFFYGSGNSTITAVNGQPFAYLYLDKTAQIISLSLIDSISISKEFAITAGTFFLGAKNATLLSNASGTASFGKAGALSAISYGTGRFIIERYIPTGTHSKSWQFLAVPANGGQTINAAWQEGHVLPVIGANNYGTIITNNVAGAGFDIIAGVGPSMKTYDPTGAGSWVGVANTTPLPLYNQKGYMILVRGDRNASAYNSPATPTTLRTTGKLFIPSLNPPPATTIAAGKFVSIGNPYASAIDFLNLSFTAAPAIDSVYYVWDPLLGGSYNLGGYQTISSVTGYKPTPGGTSNYISGVSYTQIQSGQAFLMHATGAGGTVTFTENAKTGGSKMVYRHGNEVRRQLINTMLCNADGSMLDGNTVAFSNSYRNEYDAMDALKIFNGAENFGISSNLKILSVEARDIISVSDTIHFMMSDLHLQQYRLKFVPENMNDDHVSAYLEDVFLHTKTSISLSDSSFVDFTISSDPASAATGRFMLVFKKKRRITTIPVITSADQKNKKTVTDDNFTGKISVYPNPVVNHTIQLNFINKPSGNYKIIIRNISGQAVTEQNVPVNENIFTASIQVKDLPAGLYNLEAIYENGERTTIKVIIP